MGDELFNISFFTNIIWQAEEWREDSDKLMPVGAPGELSSCRPPNGDLVLQNQFEAIEGP